MQQKTVQKAPANYVGRILFGNFSEAIKERVRTIICAAEDIERCGYPLMPYLAAWNEGENIIWYEYAGSRFVELLGCTSINVSRVFREAILDRRVYRYTDPAGYAVEEEILTRQQLSGQRIDLREEVKKTGQVEAVYQVGLPGGRVIWLKDQGRIETFAQDKLSLSLGCLTDVTKEMEQKDLLEKIGYFDELTGLPQRKIMERILEVKIGERERGHIKDFSFLMIDIDFFKSVNDLHGHLAGDFILEELASVMLATKRKEDDVGRYGGEEFYGICQGGVKSGVEFAERLRRNAAGHHFVYQGEKISITISIGVASAGELAALNMTDLLELADKRLYKAKQQGRNRVAGDGS
ncbi:MAG: GGDEF domain-containing protein [Desulfobulbaceae bacterium]|nr:GGDEF domain-containing protein [Desulfobulbaceae bacterium]